MLLCKCKTYRYCRTRPKCTAIRQTPSAPRYHGTLPRPPGVDGFGALPGQSCSPPARVGAPAPLRRGCGPSSPRKIIEPFGTSRSLASLAVSAAGHGRMVFFPPELSCDRVNPQGMEGSEPALGAGGFLWREDWLGAGAAGWVLASHARALVPLPVCPWRRVCFPGACCSSAEGWHPCAQRRRAQAPGAELQLWSGDSF